MSVLTKCPSCGLESDEMRCPRCNTLKIIGCTGACLTCKKSGTCNIPQKEEPERLPRTPGRRSSS